MPTLLQIVVEGNIGSNGRLANSIGDFVISKGWNSYIAYGRYSRPSNSKLIKIGNKFDIIYHGILTRIFDMHGLGSRRATLNLIEKIKRINPDVIQLHHLHGYFINIEILFNFFSKIDIPIVWTFHDCWSITGHCCHFHFNGCDKWLSECNNCPQLSEYPASLFFDRSKKNYYLKKYLFNSVKKLTIVSVSYWLNSIVQKSFLKNVNQIVIYNGVNTSLFKYDDSIISKKIKLNLSNKYIILGVANPWTSKKGFFDFLELSKLIDTETVIILVGLNNSQLKMLPANIIGVPKIENINQLVEYYSLADVFLNLSVEETFGLTTVEALACGTPVIVYNTTACPEILDEETGLIVETKDIIQLKSALDRIRRVGKMRYFHKCIKRAHENFDMELCLDNYFKTYNNLKNDK